MRPARFNCVEIWRIAGPQETEDVRVYKHLILIDRSIGRGLVFLDDCPWTILLTFQCKRDKKTEKDDLLISLPVNPVSFFSGYSPCLGRIFPARFSPFWLSSNTNPSHTSFKLPGQTGLRLIQRVYSLNGRCRFSLFCCCFGLPTMAKTFFVITETAPKHELRSPFPSSPNNSLHEPFVFGFPHSYAPSTLAKDNGCLVGPDNLFSIL